MTGLFYDIRGLLSAKHSGKYLCALLKELAVRDPKAFAAAFDLNGADRKRLINGEIQVEREWSFKGQDSNTRYSDLTLLAGGEVVLLVEVKEDDYASAGNPGQLKDYLGFISAGKSRFVHLSRYRPTAADQNIMNQAKAAGMLIETRRYADIYKRLSSHLSPFAQLFRGYLEDIGVASYQVIDLKKEWKEVAFLLTQCLGFPHRQGLGKLHSQAAVSAVPVLLKRMFDNLEVLGEWVRDHNQNLIAHSCTRRFTPRPSYNLKALGKAIASEQDENAPLPGERGKYVRSGVVYFHANGTLALRTKGGNTPPWFGLEIGYGLSITTKPEVKEEPIDVELYAAFLGNGIVWEGADKSGSTTFPSESQALKSFSNLLEKARNKAIKNDPEGLNTPLLKAFSVP